MEDESSYISSLIAKLYEKPGGSFTDNDSENNFIKEDRDENENQPESKKRKVVDEEEEFFKNSSAAIIVMILKIDPGGYKLFTVLLIRGLYGLLIRLFQYLVDNLLNWFGSNPGDDAQTRTSPFVQSITIALHP